MSENTVKARLRHAVKPEATWTSDNPVLKEGEVGYVKETGRYKVGDGKTAWNSLAWAQPSSHTHDDRYVKLAGGTMTGPLIIQGNAADKPLKVKGITGASGSEDGELYLQYGVNKAIMLGNVGAYNISADGGSYSGKAASATALTTSAGSATQPVYFSSGKPVACTYTLAKSVPADAKFTDTTYTAGRGITLSGTQFKLYDTCATVTDWNSATATGWYMASDAANAPATGWLYGEVIAHNPKYTRQILYRFATNSDITSNRCDRYERVQHNGAWGDWVNTSVRTEVPTGAKFTDTWRGIQNNLTSDSTSDSLSAAQGKALKALVDGVEIGGRNLIKGSHSSAVTYTYPISNSSDKYTPVTTILLNGGTYTLSFWAKSTVKGDKIRVHLYNPSNITSVKGSQGQSSTAVDGLCDFTLTTTLAKYWVTYTIPAGGNSARTIILPRLTSGQGTGTITIQWEKFEEGNRATAWCPAVEEVSMTTHTHSSVKDSNDGRSITFAYSKAGLNYSDYTWLAVWNGNELRAANKSQFAQASHTHTKSQITDFPASLKNPTSLILRLNGGATEGTNQFTYDGSTARTISITPAGIGAATSGHNHDSAYLGKTATAAAATKLATARTVSAATDFNMSFSYDGSANSTASLGYYSCISSVQNMNNYPFHRFAKIDKLAATYSDKVATFLITQDFQGGGWGIVRLALRTNSSTTVSDVEVKWLCRVGFPVDFVQVGIYNVAGSTYADAFLKHGGTYTGTVVRNLASGARGNISRTWTLINSSEVSGTTVNDAKTSTEVYATITAAGTALHSQAYSKIVAAVDGGTVSYANSAGVSTKATTDSVGQQINTTYIKSLSINGKTITYTKGDGTTGTIITQDTDSHYTTGLKVCASATGTANAAATNGNVRINVLDNTTVRDSHIIKGTGATSVTSDASGVITINSPSYSTGTTSTAGLTKLYASTGTSTDGTMTRKAITDALSGKAASNHNHDGDYVPLENGTVTVSSDMGAYIDLQDTNGGLGTHLQMSVKGASKWDLAANSNGELSLTYITSAGSNWLYAMNASGISMYQSVTVRPSPLATTANSMMVKVSTAGLQNFTGRTISLYASGSNNDYAGLYDHDNGWILYYDTSKIVHIPREITSGSLTTSGNLQWRNSSGTAYVIAGTLSNDNYKNMTRVGNLTYETGIYTKTNVWKNGSTTTYFATTTTTSDQRLKEKISDMSVYEDFFYKLKPFAFKYHDGLYNARTKKPLVQWGYGAQDTVKAFEESGLDWKQEELVVIEDGELTEEEKKYATDGQMLKMNYQNMSALNTHMIQKCLEEIAELKRQLAELKEG